MKSSKVKFKRVRPLLGTFFEIQLESPKANEAAYDRVVTLAFERAHELEKIFSRFSDEANRKSPEYKSLLKVALKIQKKTCGVFNVRQKNSSFFDLDGIAKGHIVDEVATLIEKKLPKACGLVSAGGDLRFLGEKVAEIYLRLGAFNKQFTRAFKTPAQAVASSSLTVAKNDYRSSTKYRKRLRAPLTIDHTAVVTSSSCRISDALTKVALFGTLKQVQQACDDFQAQVLIFDSHGEVFSTFAPR